MLSEWQFGKLAMQTIQSENITIPNLKNTKRRISHVSQKNEIDNFKTNHYFSDYFLG